MAPGRGWSRAFQVINMRNPYNKEGKKKRPQKVGCWNVKTMLRAGKLENVKHEMTRLGINIMGISETRWPGENEYYSDEFRVIHSGGEESQRGVAIILDKRKANAVEKICYG